MPRLKMTYHFQERMAQRSINLDHVRTAINNPDISGSGKGGEKWVVKKIGKKAIKVVYSKQGFKDKKNELILVTAYYL